MEEMQNPSQRPINPRRKKKTKAQIFKEAYLPVIIVGGAIVLILIFIIGAIVRSVQNSNAEEQAIQESITQEELEKQQLLEQEAELIAEAELLANAYNYEGAIQVLNRFTGELSEYPDISSKMEEYIDAKNQMVLWDDPNDIPNLSFQLLIADPYRAFQNEIYGSSFNRNFITTDEFQSILQQLYSNGYILVSPDDIFEITANPDGTAVCTTKELYLPAGKKPVMLTQTNVNYHYYLIDSNDDKIPDADGGGFASRLVLEADTIQCEMIDSSGQAVIGDYDMIPILETFIDIHPDFSYNDARATIALTGYNGLFGYRTEPAARERNGEDAYYQAVSDATDIADWLRGNGYSLAFYTYDNIPYGESSLDVIESDISHWEEEVVPIIGHLNTIVYAQNSDLTDDLNYSGEKYDLLKGKGFSYYVGFCTEGRAWANVAAEYIRQGRIMVSGSSLTHHADWFYGMFDPSQVLDPTRGEVPQ